MAAFYCVCQQQRGLGDWALRRAGPYAAEREQRPAHEERAGDLQRHLAPEQGRVSEIMMMRSGACESCGVLNRCPCNLRPPTDDVANGKAANQ